jgi:hypothetical protein
MQTVLKNWNVIRAIRLIAGITFLAYGYSIMDWLIIMIGFALGLMALTNSGCNPFTRSCDVDLKKDNEG